MARKASKEQAAVTKIGAEEAKALQAARAAVCETWATKEQAQVALNAIRRITAGASPVRVRSVLGIDLDLAGRLVDAREDEAELMDEVRRALYEVTGREESAVKIARGRKAREQAASTPAEPAAEPVDVTALEAEALPLSEAEKALWAKVAERVSKGDAPKWGASGFMSTHRVEAGVYLADNGEVLMRRAEIDGKPGPWTIEVVTVKDGEPVRTRSQQVFKSSNAAMVAFGLYRAEA